MWLVGVPGDYLVLDPVSGCSTSMATTCVFAKTFQKVNWRLPFLSLLNNSSTVFQTPGVVIYWFVATIRKPELDIYFKNLVGRRERVGLVSSCLVQGRL